MMRTFARHAALALALVLAGCCCICVVAAAEERSAPRCEVLSGVSAATCARLGAHGVLQPASPGAFPRERVEARLSRAELSRTLTLVTFGGSVTVGHGGPPPTYLVKPTYGELFADWLRKAYKPSGVDVRFVNLGLPAVSAAVPALCAYDMLNGTAPDVVLLEFSINADESEWSMVRLGALLAALPSQPAVLYVDTFSARALDLERGARWAEAAPLRLPALLGNYDEVALRTLRLTCFSLGAALSDAAGEDGGAGDDVAATAELRRLLAGAHGKDRVHLATGGHALLAELLAQHFATLRLTGAPATSSSSSSSSSDEAAAGADAGVCYSRATQPLRLARPSPRWAYGKLHGHDKLGWQMSNSTAGADNIGARAAFELRVPAGSPPLDVIGVSAMVNGVRNLYGIAELRLDGVGVGTFDGYANTTYNTQVTRFYRPPAPLQPGSRHALGLRMAAATSSGGHDFALVALLAARDCPQRPHEPAECMSSAHGPLGLGGSTPP